MIQKITLAEFQVMEAPVVLDVRLPEAFAAGHLPGALGNCVFEVVFLDRVGQAGVDPLRPVVVVGEGSDSQEADMAAEKLLRAGYQDVRVLDAGMDGWRAAGGAVEGSGPPPTDPVAPDGEYIVDRDASRLEWLGRNLLNKHWGDIDLAEGRFTVERGIPMRGEAVIDMHAMRCTDLHGSELHDVLIDHLRGDDFFDTARFPTARYVLERSERAADARPGSKNLVFYGHLHLKDVTRPLHIATAYGVTPDGHPALQAAFALERTLWNVRYGSGKLFRRLGGHLVNDLIEFQLRLVLRPA